MKLSKTQQALYDAMLSGVVVHFMPDRGRFGPSYYFRADNHKRCSAAAYALRDKGLAEPYDIHWNCHKLKAKAKGEQC